MAGMEAALMKVPVIREIMGLHSAEQGLANQRMSNYVNSVEAARRLAEIEAMPFRTRLQAAQAQQAEFELKRQKDAQQAMQGLYAQHMTPREVPIQGPTQPGEAPLGNRIQQPGAEDQAAYINALRMNPATMAAGTALADSMKKEWLPVGAGGLYNPTSGERVSGYGATPLARLQQARDEARRLGRDDLAAELETQIAKLNTASQGTSRTATLTGLYDFLAKAKQAGGVVPEADLAKAYGLYRLLAQPHTVATPYGNVQQPGLDDPYLLRELGQLRTSGGGGVPQGPQGPQEPGMPAPQPGGMPAPAASAPSAGGMLATPGMPAQAPVAPPQNGLPPLPAAIPQPTIRPGKPMDPKSQSTLLGVRTTRQMLEALARDFKPEYALGSTAMRLVNSALGGALANAKMELGRIGFSDPEASIWWSGMLELIAGKRHALVGATLTDHEKKMFDQLVAGLGDDPVRIRSMLENALGVAKEQEAATAQLIGSSTNEEDVRKLLERPNPYSFRKWKAKEEIIELTGPGGKTIRTKTRRNPRGELEGFIDGQWQLIGS